MNKILTEESANDTDRGVLFQADSVTNMFNEGQSRN